MDKHDVKNFDADEGYERKNMTSTVSATETTGMMYNPPHDREELSSLRDMHQLQATEFAAAQFGENEPAFPHERRGDNAGYGPASGHGAGQHGEGWNAEGRNGRQNEGRQNKDGQRADGQKADGQKADGQKRGGVGPDGYRSGWHHKQDGYGTGTDVHHPQQEGYVANAPHPQQEGYVANAPHPQPEGYGTNAPHPQPEGYGTNAPHPQPEGYGTNAPHPQPEGYGTNAPHPQPEGYGASPRHPWQDGYGARSGQPPEDRDRRGRKRRENPAKFNPELAKIDPDIDCVNGNDDRHVSMHPLSFTDWTNGEGVKY